MAILHAVQILSSAVQSDTASSTLPIKVCFLFQYIGVMFPQKCMSLQAIQREAAGADFQHRPIVAEDSLDVTESQVNRPERNRDFDWSGSTNYTQMNRKVCSGSVIPCGILLLLRLVVCQADIPLLETGQNILQLRMTLSLLTIAEEFLDAI